MAESIPVEIQLLCVPDCPLVVKAKTTLKNALGKAPNIATTVEELVGDYSSPTILIEGYDVTGHPQQQKDRPACRLDLPTEEQILDALEAFSRFGAPVFAQDGKEPSQ
jgi:hypothetical protein